MNLPSSFINVSTESGGIMKKTTSPYHKGGLNCLKLGVGLRSMILPIFMVFLWTNGIYLVEGEERKYAVRNQRERSIAVRIIGQVFPFGNIDKQLFSNH